MNYVVAVIFFVFAIMSIWSVVTSIKEKEPWSEIIKGILCSCIFLGTTVLLFL